MKKKLSKVKTILQAYENLPIKHRMLLRYRHGWMYDTKLTLQEISMALNMSKDNIKKTEAKIFRRLNKYVK